VKYLNEYRAPDTVKRLADAISALTTRPWRIMEVCGGQTHSILKYGIDQLLPEYVTLIHGPGCPVCVTPLTAIDKALAMARQPGVIFCSFGDMLRVPGSREDLLSVKARGADIRIVYSPLDALTIARQNLDKEIVFFGVGFETTAPATAIAVWQSKQDNLSNLSFLVCHVRVPPIVEALLVSTENSINGFLGAGHVCSIMGYQEYLPICHKHRKPIVITGFEPVDILQGIYLCLKQLEEKRYEVENQYRRVVNPNGNRTAQALMQNVFKVVDSHWRGLGKIPNSGLALSDEYNDRNAELRFDTGIDVVSEPHNCQSGQILQGLIKPPQCPEFGIRCTPETPLGATMVSSEGACAAYYRYRRHPHG